MDGVFREYMTVPDDTADDIIDKIKSMANFEIADNRLPKIGHIKFKRDGLPEFLLKVTANPADGPGENIVLKIPDPQDA
jgi:type II secretory ATPase GspE/PulE/Tfp pilus assembly ATPase PilB-like protein